MRLAPTILAILALLAGPALCQTTTPKPEPTPAPSSSDRSSPSPRTTPEPGQSAPARRGDATEDSKRNKQPDRKTEQRR
jgi:hypothetical protein